MRNFLHGIARVIDAHARAVLYHTAALFRTEIQAKTPSVSKFSDGNRSFIRHSVITAPGAPRIDRQYARACNNGFRPGRYGRGVAVADSDHAGLRGTRLVVQSLCNLGLVGRGPL